MDNRYNLMRQGSEVWSSLRDGDFEEGDVWDALEERKYSTSNYEKSREASFSVERNIHSAARMIPRTSNSSSISKSSYGTKVLQQSAPVNVPDWSGFCKKKSKKASRNSTSLNDDDEDNELDGDDCDGGVNEDSDYDYKLPPHELIAKRLARSQISSFSVFEGVGRTLKGRDLSKVRNAVLTRTGFLESS